MKGAIGKIKCTYFVLKYLPYSALPSGWIPETAPAPPPLKTRRLRLWVMFALFLCVSASTWSVGVYLSIHHLSVLLRNHYQSVVLECSRGVHIRSAFNINYRVLWEITQSLDKKCRITRVKIMWIGFVGDFNGRRMAGWG